MRAEAELYRAAAERGTFFRLFRLLPVLLRDLPPKFVLERLPLL